MEDHGIDRLACNLAEAQLKFADMTRKYQDLVMELNEQKMSDKCRHSELKSELKMKKIEADRLTTMYVETHDKYRAELLEKERVTEKLNLIQDELINFKSNASQQISELHVKLKEKSTRLETYEKLETELDKVVLQAATLPGHQDATEILSAYGHGVNIPCDVKRRVEQSLGLARRVLELEYRAAGQKEELFSTRDENMRLKEELHAAKSALLNSGRPTGQLLQVVQKRDQTIFKLTSKVKELDLTVDKITKSNMKLMDELKVLSRFVQSQNRVMNSTATQTLSQHVTMYKCNGNESNLKTLPKSSSHSVTASPLKSISQTHKPAMRLPPRYYNQYNHCDRSSGGDDVVYLSNRISDQSDELTTFVHVKQPLSFNKVTQSGQDQ